MLEKLKIVRRQLVRDIKRKEGGGKYTYGPDPKATKKDLQSLDEYIADLKDKIKVEGYYGEGAEAEKALLESDSSLPFSKLVKDRYRSAEGGSVTTPKRGLVDEAGSYAGNRRKDEYSSDVVDSGLLDIGFDNMSLEEIKDLLKAASTYKTGGRVGFRGGKSVKDGIAAILKLGNKKFGKDTIKVADDIEPSEFSKFNERNKVLDDLDIEDYEGELGDPETWYTFGMTVREADELVKSRKAYEAEMFTEYKAGRLDPKPGEKGREKFLQKKLEEAEMSGDNKLITLEELDELDALQGGPGRPPGFVPRGLRNVPVEMMTARIIRAKYPQIPDKMVEQIASLPNDKKALALADLEQAIMLQESGRSSDEIIEILKREPKTKMKKGGLAQILEM